MSSSWNFPAKAESSLGTSICELKPELKIFLLELWLKPAWLGLIASNSLYMRRTKNDENNLHKNFDSTLDF